MIGHETDLAMTVGGDFPPSEIILSQNQTTNNQNTNHKKTITTTSTVIITMANQDIQLPTPATTVMEDHTTMKTAQPAAQDNLTLPYVPEDCGPSFHERQSPLFLGCLCDMRRAVIAINIIGISFAFIGVVFAVIGLAFAEDIKQDDLAKDMELHNSFVYGQVGTQIILGLSLGIGLLSILIYSLGIYGAAKFNICLVGTTTVYHALNFAAALGQLILNFDALSAFGLIMSALFLYPHFALWRYMQRGIMTEENYAVERRTCCGC